MAERIPSPELRHDALDALTRKRGQSDGAALFAILPRRRNRHYLRLLCTYQVAWDYLDSVSERGAHAGVHNGRQLHLALADALSPGGAIRDYYRFSPWNDDGGYLQSLVEVCRECCQALPSFECVRPLVLRDATRAQVLALNHEPNAASREELLIRWVKAEFPNRTDVRWYEISGAASAGLQAFAVLALACEPTIDELQVRSTHAAYFWASAVACMLDSYADQADDEANGDHSYIAYYPTTRVAITETCRLIRRCMSELGDLDNGEAHLLIAACMIALYLSRDSSRSAPLRDYSRLIALAGGPLVRRLLPVLRTWRIAYSLRSS